MSATKNPDQALPTNAPTITRDYIPGVGETRTEEWPIGERSDIKAKYDQLVFDSKIGGFATGNLTQLSMQSREGRASLVARFEDANPENGLNGTDTRVVEELYAMDVIKDISAAPYFSTVVATKLTDDQVAVVRKAVREDLLEAEIDGYAAWSASQKELRWLMLHGQESYYETAFAVRQSLYGVITSTIQASFTDINQVVNAPVLSNQMNLLLDALPAGEWLYRPPQAEHIGNGKWRITKEWQWASAWSKVYGGTMGL